MIARHYSEQAPEWQMSKESVVERKNDA